MTVHIIGVLFACLLLRVALPIWPKLCLVVALVAGLLWLIGLFKKKQNLLIWGSGLLLFFCWCFTIPMSELRGRAAGRLVACKSNLKNIATAIGMYQTDFEDESPNQLSQLTPNFLRTIPVCPAYGDDTPVPLFYLKPPGSREYLYQAQGEQFQVFCHGRKHRAAKLKGSDYPRYYSDSRGLVESPEGETQTP